MEKHTLQELQEKQAMPLKAKIEMSMMRIQQWVMTYGKDNVYISFSGGKDSTVLLDLVRNKCGYKDIEAVFVDTGLEYPEIRDFVKTFDNVTWLKPKMNFKAVIEKYGYPLISKETSECVYGARKCLTNLLEENNADEQASKQASKQATYSYRLDKIYGHGKYANKLKAFSQEKYKFFLDAPFEISSQCCNIMKKSPIHSYNKQKCKKPILGQMATESRLRTQEWLKNGCNGFNMKNPVSNPMSFWTEQDVLLYIRLNNLPICSVYGEVLTEDEIDGQMVIGDFLGLDLAELFEFDRPTFTTTGYKRTGCMFCGYGCHLEKSPNRFEKMKITHPKQYEYIMKPWSKGGLGYKEVIDWINEHGNMNIKY